MLRTVLTVLIIALGITALVVVNTAIKAINQKFTESFSTMGASGFTIRYKDRNIRFGGGGGSEIKKEKKGSKKEKKSNLGKIIRKEEEEMIIQMDTNLDREEILTRPMYNLQEMFAS